MSSSTHIDNRVPPRSRVRSSGARLCLGAGLSLLASTILVALPVVGAHPGAVAAAASDPILVAAGNHGSPPARSI